jgi:broad specificity phosphatase PhoE
MIAVDHPLSERGVSEAMALNKAIKTASKPTSATTASQMLEVNEFLNAPLVISSPLTRALQTAMIALKDHPTVWVFIDFICLYMFVYVLLIKFACLSLYCFFFPFVSPSDH